MQKSIQDADEGSEYGNTDVMYSTQYIPSSVSQTGALAQTHRMSTIVDMYVTFSRVRHSISYKPLQEIPRKHSHL